eukprot:2951341-Pyramimonas_sp.AAC.1
MWHVLATAACSSSILPAALLARASLLSCSGTRLLRPSLPSPARHLMPEALARPRSDRWRSSS